MINCLVVMIDMLNEVLKNKFLAQVGYKDKKNTFVMNIVVSKFEDILQKDLGEFNRSDAIYMLEKSGYFNLQTLRSIIRACKLYCRWTIENKFFHTSINPFDHIKIEDIDLSDTLRKNIIQSPDELAEIVSSVHRIDDVYMEAPILCFLWLGISYHDMTSIRKKDFDYNSRFVYVPSKRKYYRHIPAVINDILHKYNTTDVATRIVNGGKYEVQSDYSERFIKRMLPKRSGLYGVPVSDKTLLSAFSGFTEDYAAVSDHKKHLDKDAVAKSGVLYTILCMERSGISFNNHEGDKIISQLIESTAQISINDTLYIYNVYKKVFY